jgi:hypothetical protein
MRQIIYLMTVIIIIPVCLSFYFIINSRYFNSLKDICKQKAKTICLKTIYNLFYVYSVCEINCTKVYNYILPCIKSIQNKRQYFLEKYNIISQNEVILNIESMNTRIEVYNDTGLQVLQKDVSKRFEDMIICDLEYVDDFSYYTMIVTDLFLINDLNKNIQNKKVINNLDNCEFSFEISDITFIALYLNYNDVRYNINLKTDDFNFYVVGNIINKSFIQYYIKNILHHDILINTDEIPFLYKLELMDHEVNVVELDNTQYIIIEKNGYRIDRNKKQNMLEIQDDYIKI